MTLEELRGFIARIAHDGDCWLWTGALSGGYGEICGARRIKAHVAAYEHFVGPVPADHELDHLCRRRSCVNPSHLEAVTHRENVLRGEGIAAKNARKTECKRGHSFDDANTGINPTTGTRFCKTCARLTKRRHATKQRIAAKTCT